MIASLPLHEMSVQDKISAMESIWDDLCRNTGNIESPGWHREVLDRREKSLAAGTDTFIDWEDAKRSIRSKIL